MAADVSRDLPQRVADGGRVAAILVAARREPPTRCARAQRRRTVVRPWPPRGRAHGARPRAVRAYRRAAEPARAGRAGTRVRPPRATAGPPARRREPRVLRRRTAAAVG